MAGVDAGPHAVIGVINPAALLANCADLHRVYRATGAQLLVTEQRNIAYGCAAQYTLSTLDIDYERRGWLLRMAATRPISRILIQGWTCRSFSARAGTCRSEGHGTVLLTTMSRPGSVSLALGGITLRGATRRS